MSIRFVDLEPGDPRLERDVLPVLAELRTELTADAFASIYAEGHRQGLRFTAVFNDEERCLGVAGWRLIATTVARRKLYVDDLVTTASGRSQGVGGALLDELSERARSAGCRVIDLDSAVHRSGAHRFYMHQRMAITAFHFGKAVD
jgi:GNAT superfamily N-acetyltransferase